MTTLPQFKFAVNPHVCNKDKNHGKLIAGFQDKQGDLQDVVNHIKQGHAICSGLLNGQRKENKNFCGSHWIPIDIDNSDYKYDENGKKVKDENNKAVKVYKHELTLEDAIAHPFIQQHGGLIYTSASHKPDWHRFRIVFPLPQFVESAEIYEAAVRLLLEILPGDTACKDVCRAFYGNTNAEIPLFNPEASLPSDWIEKATEAAKERAKKKDEQTKEFSKFERTIGIETFALLCLFFINPNRLNWEEWRDVLLAAHSAGLSESEVRLWSSRSGIHTDKGFNDVWKYIKSKSGGLTAGSLYKWANDHDSEGLKKAIADLHKVVKEDTYKRQNSYTGKVWKEIDTALLNADELGLEKGAVYIVISPKGTGKTKAMIPTVQKFKTVYAWYNRIALGRSACSKLGLVWHDEAEKISLNQKLGFTCNSAYKYPAAVLKDDGLLLLDEFDQLSEQNFDETCDRDGIRPMILNSLKYQIEAAIFGKGMVVCMSADISDSDVAYIKALVPSGCPVRVIRNNYKPELPTIKFHVSKSPDQLISEMIEGMDKGEPQFLVDDTKDGRVGAKTIAEMIRVKRPDLASKIVEINSETSGSDEIREYLKDIDTASADTLLLSCTPSVTSGISSENGHFKTTNVITKGILSVKVAAQATARVRGCQDIKVWAATRTNSPSHCSETTPEAVNNFYQDNYKANTKIHASRIQSFATDYSVMKEEWSSPHFKRFCDYEAYRNLCAENFRELLKKKYIEEGYKIQELDSDENEDIEESLKRSDARLELTRATEVANAMILTEEELKDLEGKAQSPQDALNIAKTWLLKKYGQEIIDTIEFHHKKSGTVLTGYAAMHLKDNRGKYHSSLKALYNLIVATDEEVYNYDLKREDEQLSKSDERFAGDIRWYARQRKARLHLGLDKFLNPDKVYTPQDFKELGDKARKHPKAMKQALGVSFGSTENDAQIFRTLIEQLGFTLVKSKTKGSRRNSYQISPESWELSQLYLSHRSEPTEIENDIPPCNLYYEEIGGVCKSEPMSCKGSSDSDQSLLNYENLQNPQSQCESHVRLEQGNSEAIAAETSEPTLDSMRAKYPHWFTDHAVDCILRQIPQPIEAWAQYEANIPAVARYHVIAYAKSKNPVLTPA